MFTATSISSLFGQQSNTPSTNPTGENTSTTQGNSSTVQVNSSQTKPKSSLDSLVLLKDDTLKAEVLYCLKMSASHWS